MGNGESALKVFVDEKKKKVMFAEAEEDFVEILFSFFTLPLGTIAKLLRSHEDSKDTKIGSLSSLYGSIVNLNITHFSHEYNKRYLLHPLNSSARICRKLKRNPNNHMMLTGNCGPVFLNKTKFFITDDLKVVPVVLDTSIGFLNSLGVDYIDSLQERTMYFCRNEFLNLLKWSLLTNDPLTNLVLGGSNTGLSFFTKSVFSNPAIVSSNSGHTQTVRLLVQKSKKKVLFAQVENGFVELLFSFLTVPLGAYECLTKGHSSSVGISNLYKSISYLGDGKYCKSEDVKTMLLRPKVSPSYRRVTDLLPIYELDTQRGHFLKKQATFTVSDDLKITPSPATSIDTISKFNTHGVPIGDMEILELSIGEHEALLLLEVSLTSTSTLTDWFRVIRSPKDHVSNIAFAGDGGREMEEEANCTFKEEKHKDKLYAMLD